MERRLRRLRFGLAFAGKLRELVLSGSDVDDSDLREIGKIKTLTKLLLVGCPQIRDGGVLALAGLSNLEVLDIYQNEKISFDAIRKIRAALPKCDLISDDY